jgi:tetratricopeptide (TPR) repeat protein
MGLLALMFMSRLQMLAVPSRPPETPVDLGRIWLAYSFYGSPPQMMRFFAHFDLFSLVMGLLGSFVVGLLAFIAGWGYGKWRKLPEVPRPLDGNMERRDLVGANESITVNYGVSGQSPESMRDATAHWAALIGAKESQFYLAQFEHVASARLSRKSIPRAFPISKYMAALVGSWNWSAFFLNYAWALYRKLYGWSAALFVMSFVCLLAILEGARAFGFFSLVAAWLAFGRYANALYYSKATKTIAEARRLADSEEEIIAKLRDNGGVQGWASFVAAGHALLGIPALLLVLAGQQSTAPASIPGSATTSSPGGVVDAITSDQEPPSTDSALDTITPDVVDSDRHIRDLYDARRFSELVQFARQQLTEYPNDTLAANYAGLACMGMRNPKEARRWFEKAVELSPESPSLYYNLASTYDLRTDYTKIIEILTAAHQINPDNANVNDALISAQRYAQQIETERAAQAPIRAIQPSSRIQTADESDCEVKPVMTDEEIRHWRKCSPR